MIEPDVTKVPDWAEAGRGKKMARRRKSRSGIFSVGDKEPHFGNTGGPVLNAAGAAN